MPSHMISWMEIAPIYPRLLITQSLARVVPKPMLIEAEWRIYASVI